MRILLRSLGRTEWELGIGSYWKPPPFPLALAVTSELFSEVKALYAYLVLSQAARSASIESWAAQAETGPQNQGSRNLQPPGKDGDEYTEAGGC